MVMFMKIQYFHEGVDIIISTGTVLIVSVSKDGRQGSMSLAMKCAGQVLVTRLDGQSTSDAGDRLSRLLARKYARQVIVFFSVPRTINMDEEREEDGIIRVVLERVSEVL